MSDYDTKCALSEGYDPEERHQRYPLVPAGGFSQTTTMKIYTCNKFTGVWPVGTAAVVAANNRKTAAAALNESAKADGLKGDAQPEDMEEFEIPTNTKPSVRILCNGDY